MPQMLMLDVSIFGLNDEGWKVKWNVLKRKVVSKPYKGHNQCVLEKDIVCPNPSQKNNHSEIQQRLYFYTI